MSSPGSDREGAFSMIQISYTAMLDSTVHKFLENRNLKLCF